MEKRKIEMFARFLFIGLFIVSMFAIPVKQYAANVEADASASAIVAKAYSKIGSKYVYGASHSYSAIKNPNQKTFDCSGFVSWVYYQSGHSIGVRTSSSLASVGTRVSYNQLQPGDILLFPHHAGIYIGGGKMIHAPNSKSRVRVQSLSGYYRNRFKQGRRVVRSSSEAAKAVSQATSAVDKNESSSRNYSKGTYKLKTTMTVRSGASTRYKRVGSLGRGTKIQVHSIENGKWAKIKFNGTYRYVSLAYASRV